MKIKRKKKKTPLRKVTTVHKDLTDRLIEINPALYDDVRKILDINKKERHIRGGMATKKKYEKMHHTI